MTDEEDDVDALGDEDEADEDAEGDHRHRHRHRHHHGMAGPDSADGASVFSEDEESSDDDEDHHDQQVPGSCLTVTQKDGLSTSVPAAQG